MGLWITGKRVKGSWLHAEEDTSVYEFKSCLLNIFFRLGVAIPSLIFNDLKNDIWATGQQICKRGGKVIAEYGIVSKKQSKKFEIEAPIYYADICWTELMKLIKKNVVSYKEISKHPAVSRDLAF